MPLLSLLQHLGFTEGFPLSGEFHPVGLEPYFVTVFVEETLKAAQGMVEAEALVFHDVLRVPTSGQTHSPPKESVDTLVSIVL